MDRNLKKDIVPWKNPAEFIKVYECAYSDDLKKNRWAVEQIAVWETRCWPSLPTAVEATLLLVKSKIQDNLYEANKFFCNAHDVEMMYSGAVVRFVNLLIEKDQNTKSKKRLYTLAAERNIPLWIVEIRHNSTHGFHPTLPILRMAYETLMAYIEKIFWLPEKSRVRAIRKTINETPMVELYQNYRMYQYQVVADTLVAATTKKKEKQEVDTRARNKALGKMDSYLKKREFRRTFLDVLVRDFVTLDDVKAMISDDEVFMDVNLKSSVIPLPFSLQQFYYPLIKLLHKHDLISTFLELLLLSQDKRDYLILQKVVDHAVVYVFQLTKAAEGVSRQAAMPFVCKGANLNLYRLLYSCVRGCSPTVKIVFEWLVKEMDLKNFTSELTAMMNIKLGNSLQHDSKTPKSDRKKRKFNDITFTVEDLEEDINEVLDRSNYRKTGPWSLAPLSIDWASIPIGHVFNPVDISQKEESTHEGETSSAENDESPYGHATEESKPIVTPQPENFIFKECPKRTGMLYRRKGKII